MNLCPSPSIPTLLRAVIAGSSSSLAAGLPLSLDFSTVSKLQAIMPPSAIRELYTVYVADTRKRISDLERYSASGDEESVRRCAHALKGSAAMAGVPGIASIAARLEAGRLPPRTTELYFTRCAAPVMTWSKV